MQQRRMYTNLEIQMNTNTRYDVNRAGDTSEYQLLMWI